MKPQLLHLSIISIVFFLLLTFFVDNNMLTVFDLNTSISIQRFTPKSWDVFLSTFSLLGSFELISVLLVLILLSIRKIFVLLSFVMYGFGHFVEVLGKIFLIHPNPPHKFFRYSLKFVFPSSYVQTGSSYPSGHSFRIVFFTVIFIFFIYQLKKLTKNNKSLLIVSSIILTLIMLFSRVSLGEHWPTDVLGGSLLGLGLGSISIYFLNKRIR